MKNKFTLLALLMVGATSLTACEYNFSYDIPVYPVEEKEPEKIVPKEIFLSASEKSLFIGDTFNLYATVSPTNAEDQSITWSTEDANIAAVSSSGEVTAVSKGQVLITAKSNVVQNVSASCLIKVDEKIVHVEEISLSSEQETIKIGRSVDLFATVLPENATNKNVTWSSSDPSVASVDEGKVNGISGGVVIITASTEDGNKIATCEVTVDTTEETEVVTPTGMNLNPTTKSLSVDESFQLIAKVLPDNASDKSVSWKSSNSSIVSVSASGLIRALAVGNAAITATSNGNKEVSATCIVSVVESAIPVVAVSLSESSKTLNEGENFGLTATISPSTATNKNVSWSSSNDGVATVINGVVTAVSPGNTFITVTTEDGNKTATCAITVKGQQGSADPGFEDTGVEDAGTYDIKIWCDERIKPLIETQIGNFQAHFKDNRYTINLKVDDVSEGSAASMMTEDVASGADIYVFAQDQLAKLKTAGALAAITGDIAKAVKSETEVDGINAASISGKMYAYPFTSDNGYFLYYDRKYVSDEDAKDIEKIVQDCEKNELKFNYSIFGNGFYSASYFMATGCESLWQMDEQNRFVSYTDTYNSQNGFIAAKGIQYLAQHNIFANSDDPSKFGRDKGGIGACVSGIWNYQYALNAFKKAGDETRLGCAPMPSFTYNGERHHISSFSGYKLIGVKPQTDKKRVSVCKRIARYLSAETCQLERFNQVGWGPTNISALGKDAVKNHPGLKALRAQQPYSKPQVQCPSSWYGSVSSLAAAIKADSTDNDIWAQLKAYEDNLESLLND